MSYDAFKTPTVFARIGEREYPTGDVRAVEIQAVRAIASKENFMPWFAKFVRNLAGISENAPLPDKVFVSTELNANVRTGETNGLWNGSIVMFATEGNQLVRTHAITIPSKGPVPVKQPGVGKAGSEGTPLPPDQAAMLRLMLAPFAGRSFPVYAAL